MLKNERGSLRVRLFSTSGRCFLISRPQQPVREKRDRFRSKGLTLARATDSPRTHAIRRDVNPFQRSKQTKDAAEGKIYSNYRRCKEIRNLV